jgi:transcriptional regulator with XRE-family HTH domain
VLRGHRRAARLTLEQLAEVSGVSARTLSDMERGRSKGPQHRTVTALADALALAGEGRQELVELARDGRLRDHWTRPAGLCEVPRLVDDFTGRAAELVWMSELVYAESAPGAGLEGVRRLVLGPLSSPEATELLTAILGQRAARDDESALSQLAGLCEGMPLALRIIGNRLVSRPGWDAAELAARLADEEHRLEQRVMRRTATMAPAP